jgi:hypothetical protein
MKNKQKMKEDTRVRGGREKVRKTKTKQVDRMHHDENGEETEHAKGLPKQISKSKTGAPCSDGRRGEENRERRKRGGMES